MRHARNQIWATSLASQRSNHWATQRETTKIQKHEWRLNIYSLHHARNEHVLWDVDWHSKPFELSKYRTHNVNTTDHLLYGFELTLIKPCSNCNCFTAALCISFLNNMKMKNKFLEIVSKMALMIFGFCFCFWEKHERYILKAMKSLRKESVLYPGFFKNKIDGKFTF
jgi:hypothetical protein